MFGKTAIAAFCGVGFLLLPVAARAVPALPFPVEMRQPDGTVFMGRIRGDEFAGWAEDGEGRAVVRNPDTGWLEYGALDPEGRRFLPTGRVVNPAEPPEDLPKHVAPARDSERVDAIRGMLRRVRSERGSLDTSPTQGVGPGWNPPPLAGERKVLVILAEFTNRSLVSTPAVWGSKIFGLDPADKSVAKYFTENSFGQFTIVPAAQSQDPTVPGVVRVSLDIAHPNYGGDITELSEIPWLNLALQKAAAYVDFHSFDTFPDGILDPDELTVYFVAAGFESSVDPSNVPSIWAHAATWSPGITPGSNLYFRQWAAQGELFDASTPMGIGVLAHELGHSLCGLPDLYDTTYTNAGLGAFSLMAAGSWGFSDASEIPGETPVALDAWCRENLDWGSAQASPLSGDGVSLPAALSVPSTYVKLNNDERPDEYWLVENRRPLSWDRGIWGVIPDEDWYGGVLILHVDNAVGTNDYAPGRPQGVMAEEAGSGVCSPATPSTPILCVGAQSNLFYSGNNSTFGPNSVPASRYHDESNSGLELSAISSPADVMTASFAANVPAIDKGGALGRAFGGTGGSGGLCFITTATGEGEGRDLLSVVPYAVLILSAFGGACGFFMGNVLRKKS